MRSRVRIAVVGAIVAGVIAALLAGQSGLASGQPGGSLALTTGQDSGSGLVQGEQDGTPTGSASPVATAHAHSTPLPTPAPSATPTPRPCPTPVQPPVGVQVTLHGVVAADPDQTNNTFPYHISCGGTITVRVNGSTTYYGQATGLASLHREWQADITGSYQSDGTFLAVSIDASADN